VLQSIVLLTVYNSIAFRVIFGEKINRWCAVGILFALLVSAALFYKIFHIDEKSDSYYIILSLTMALLSPLVFCFKDVVI